jgi:hypothetical protein
MIAARPSNIVYTKVSETFLLVDLLMYLNLQLVRVASNKSGEYSKLINVETNTWGGELIRGIFLSVDAERILNIPLARG